jgi:hypothetical protein
MALLASKAFESPFAGFLICCSFPRSWEYNRDGLLLHKRSDRSAIKNLLLLFNTTYPRCQPILLQISSVGLESSHHARFPWLPAEPQLWTVSLFRLNHRWRSPIDFGASPRDCRGVPFLIAGIQSIVRSPSSLETRDARPRALRRFICGPLC